VCADIAWATGSPDSIRVAISVMTALRRGSLSCSAMLIIPSEIGTRAWTSTDSWEVKWARSFGLILPRPALRALATTILSGTRPCELSCR